MILVETQRGGHIDWFTHGTHPKRVKTLVILVKKIVGLLASYGIFHVHGELL